MKNYSTKQMRCLVTQSLYALIVSIGLICPKETLAVSDVLRYDSITITIDGYLVGSFTELRGIVSEIEASELWENNGPILPGALSPPTIVLRRPGKSLELDPDDPLVQWHEAVRAGTFDVARRSFSYALLSKGMPVQRYWCERGWPSKAEITGLPGKPVVETWEFVCEYIQRVAP